MALLIKEKQLISSERFDIALQYLANSFGSELKVAEPLELEAIDSLIGWEY